MTNVINEESETEEKTSNVSEGVVEAEKSSSEEEEGEEEEECFIEEEIIFSDESGDDGNCEQEQQGGLTPKINSSRKRSLEGNGVGVQEKTIKKRKISNTSSVEKNIIMGKKNSLENQSEEKKIVIKKKKEISNVNSDDENITKEKIITEDIEISVICGKNIRVRRVLHVPTPSSTSPPCSVIHGEKILKLNFVHQEDEEKEKYSDKKTPPSSSNGKKIEKIK